MTSRLQPRFSLALLVVASSLSACVEQGSDLPSTEVVPGQTDFTTLVEGNFGAGRGADAGTSAGAGGSSGSATPGAPAASPPNNAPAGRVANVEEADTYRLAGSRLYYLNTYRGFLVYDVADPKHPVAVSRLPIYGYPVEMFVEGNMVYALLRDALYLTTVEGKLQFQRHNVSQLVTIDVSDPAAPVVRKTMDIVGQLREGVSRKVDSTIYVVSQQWGGYSWGWPSVDVVQREQAWVYSYDVSDPGNPRQAGQLQIFEGGNRVGDSSGRLPDDFRYFSGASISATANALMVVENWWSNGGGACWSSSQHAVVSLIDISDPKGSIRRHTRFETVGALDDQFKMTYRSDPITGKGTFYGIFAQQNWGGCQGTSTTENILETWDVSVGESPKRLAQLKFGKPNETVRASSYDLSRNVVFAITARQIDPLYAIDISNPAAPRVLSEIDGLSGSVSVFRQVAGGQFLLGVGTDQSDSCAGVQDGNPTWQSTRMALTIIDVRRLDRIRLVQRKCVTIKNAGWSWSSVNWNLDQAHKMLGMFQDGELNVLTVPVSYAVKEDAEGQQNAGWWYHMQTAVGLLSWDLTRYDDTKDATQQTVIQGYGTFLHPEGEVSRSILFRHPSSGQRSMINVSDTHLSVANIQDLDNPRLESIVEVAPAVSEIYSFGGLVVERVDLGGGRWSPMGMSEFRVKEGGGGLSGKTPVATFRVGQASAVYRFKDNLVVLRNEGAKQEALVYGLGDPLHPRLLSRTEAPLEIHSYYSFYCGVGWGYWFGEGEQTVMTEAGLAWLRRSWNSQRSRLELTLSFLDLRDPSHPVHVERGLASEDWSALSLVRDPAAAAFYLTHRKHVETVTDRDGAAFTSFRYYAQRWDVTAGQLAAKEDINLPGTLARTWVEADGRRRFLTHDNVYRETAPQSDGQRAYPVWRSDSRLNLLREVPGGAGKATLLDTRTFPDVYLKAMVLGGGKLFVGTALQSWWWGPQPSGDTRTWEQTSDRLMIIDVASGKLAPVYDQPLRAYNSQLMGYQDGNLFLSITGDGVLVTDVSDPARPRARRFMRTLGWGTHIEFAGDHAYVPSGNFGVFELDLKAPGDLAAN
jgi:hypothetical protein